MEREKSSDGLSPHSRLLLDLTRLLREDRLGQARRRVAAHLPSEEAWERLTEAAGAHRLLGYVARLAKDADAVPDAVRDRARRALDGMRAHYIYRLAHVREIAEILAGLPFRLLKGLVLAQTVHREPELRPFGDIDIFVPPPCVIPAIERLCARGFAPIPRQTFPWPPREWMKREGFVPAIDEIVVVRDAILLEIHPTLVSFKLPHSVPERELLAGAVNHAVDGEGFSVPTLSAEDNWIHFCVNHHLHRFGGGLGALLEIAKWEERFPLDAPRAAEKIRRWKVGYLVLPVLSRLKTLFPDLPSVRAFGVPPVPERDIFSAVSAARKTRSTPWYWIRKSPSPCRTLLRNVFLPRNQAALRYSRSPDDPRLWVDRMLRPFELLRRHGRKRSGRFPLSAAIRPAKAPQPEPESLQPRAGQPGRQPLPRI